jgi:hypothetical protein
MNHCLISEAKVLGFIKTLGDAVVDRLRRKARPVSPQRSSWRSFEVSH